MCKALLAALAVVLIAAATVSAQQPVTLAGVGYDPCLDPAKVLTIVIQETAASGNTEHVAISGSTRIYLCGGGLQGGAAGIILVRFGTGTACATSPTNVSAISVVTDGDGKNLTSPGTWMRSATGQALCTNRSASMTLRGELRYVQE